MLVSAFPASPREACSLCSIKSVHHWGLGRCRMSRAGRGTHDALSAIAGRQGVLRSCNKMTPGLPLDHLPLPEVWPWREGAVC